MEVVGFKDLGEIRKREYMSKFILSNGSMFFVKFYLPEIWDVEDGNYVRGMRWVRDKASLIKHGMTDEEINIFQNDAAKGKWRKVN